MEGSIGLRASDDLPALLGMAAVAALSEFTLVRVLVALATGLMIDSHELGMGFPHRLREEIRRGALSSRGG